MKSIRLFLLLTFVLFLLLPLNAQLSDEQERALLEEIIQETKYNEELTKQILEVSNRINALKLLNRSDLDKKIKAAIQSGNIAGAEEYFNLYASVLDTLVVTDPKMSKRLLTKVKGLYESVPSVWDRIYFYSGSTDYFLTAYVEAEKNLKTMLELYPASVKRNIAISMILKTYLMTNQINKAIALITLHSATFNDDNRYLAGHVYFAAEQDSVASDYFRQISDIKYTAESQKMLALISIYQNSPEIAKDRLLSLLAGEPNSPFILLSLARVSSLLGNWEDSEKYYYQYNQTLTIQNVISSQYELAMAFINLGEYQKASDLLNELLVNPDLGGFLSPVLYLLTEVATQLGQVASVEQKISEVSLQLTENQNKLPEKVDMMNRIMSLKQNSLANPGIDFVNKTIDDVSVINGDLDILNTQLLTKPIGISPVQLKRWQLYEKQLVLSYLDMLENYVKAHELRNVPDSTHIKQLESLEDIYNDQLTKIDNIRANLTAIVEANPSLAIRNEIEHDIIVYDQVLANLNRTKLSGSPRYTASQIDSLIVTYERQKSEAIVLLEYYDYDNTTYNDIVSETESSVGEIKQLLNMIPELKEQYRTSYPKLVSEAEKRNIRKEIERSIVLAPEYLNSINNQQVYITKLQRELEFIGIHNAYAVTGFYDQQKSSNEKSLTYEENQRLFAENQTRKQAVYNRLLEFITKYPDFASIEKTSEYPSFINAANIYYELAELSYSLWQNKPEVALDYFRKVNIADENFFNRDAVLYNIAYISSMLEKKRIEDGLERFDLAAANTQNKPEELKYTEISYKEAIDGYKTIINSYKDSPYYSEAILRLGYIYFEIGTDAERPIEYYQIARGYYDVLANNPADPYHYQAKYQRGWTWLNSSSQEAYESAMSDFVAILKAIDEGVITDPTEAIDYTVASIKNIGYCLIGLDGANIGVESKGAKYAQITMAGLVNKKNRNDILDEAIKQKMKLYLHGQAIDFMNVKINLDPLDQDNPLIADSISALYVAYPNQIRNGSTVDSVYYAEMKKIVENYGLNSEWYNANKDKAIPKQLAVLNKAYSDVEKRANNQFIDNPTEANFSQYAALIDSYMAFTALHDDNFAVWSKDKQANLVAMSNMLAQATNNPVYYLLTGKRIYTFNDANPDNPEFFNMEGVAFNCVKTVVDTLKADYLKRQQENPIADLPATDDSLAIYYEYAANRFTGMLLSDKFKSPENDNLYVNIVLQQAELARSKNQLDKSRNYYITIINFKGNIANEILKSSCINLAEIADSTKNFVDAEKWYRTAEGYAGSTAERDLIHQLALVQVQNSIDNAKAKGDNKLVAEEYLRLSAEYAQKDNDKTVQYKGAAQVAYWEAKEYQKSIDLLLQIADTKTQAADVLNLYRLAWTLADSVGFRQQADSLKQTFIAKFPSSNESYQLRLGIIDTFASNNATAQQAGDLYMAMYQDVVNRRIDSGTEKAEDLYLAAIGMYNQAGNEREKQRLAEEFTTLYPNNPETINLMEYLADRALAISDTVRYEQIAKTIYQKDKTRSSRYVNLIKDRLRKIASDFGTAYRDQNWTLAFAKRDDFKKMHTTYEREGLKLEFGPIYEAFTQAETEYASIQERIAFMKKFDSQLASIEAGLMTKRAADLIRINPNTSFKNNLVGGKDNRIQALKTLVAAQVKQVTRLLESSQKYNLDVERRLKAFDLICRMNEFGAEVIKTQLDQYMKVTVEFQKFKKQFEGNEEELYATFNAQRDGHANSMLQQAYPYYMAMYKYFYIPGLKNAYSIRAFDKLTDLGALPRYRIDQKTIGSDWQLSLADIADTTDVRVYDNARIGSVVSPLGASMSQVLIPANKTLVLKKNSKLKVAPEYMIANVVTPYQEDTMFKVNGVEADYSFNPIDTLEAGKPSTTRYAMSFAEGAFADGDNSIEMRFPNYGTEPLSFSIGLTTIVDSAKIEASIPVETVKIVTDDYWQYAVKDSTGALSAWKFVTEADQFGFEKSQWYEMDTTTAKPVWLAMEDRKDSQTVVFKKDFRFDGVLREGSILYIAPDTATIKLNGQEIATESLLNYDPEAKLVFAGRLSLTADQLKPGVNSIEILVNNQSQWKGMVAEISMTVAHPEVGAQ